MKPFSLHEAMHLPGGKYGEPARIAPVQDYLRNEGSTNRSGTMKSYGASHTGYDVATRVAIPSAKAAGERSRTMRKMKSQ